MREIIYYSKNAKTSGNVGNMVAAGRLDIACHTILQSVLVSHKLRNDVVLHLIFDGPPYNPLHIKIESQAKLPFMKDNILKLLKKMMYKGRKGNYVEVAEGYSVERKSLDTLADELGAAGKTIYALDAKGSHIRDMNAQELHDAVFVLGDDDGLPKKFLKRDDISKVSLGPVTYLASQVIAILHHEIDMKSDVVELR